MSIFSAKKQVNEVFGVAPSVLPDSYVDRGDLDEKIQKLLTKKKHIVIRGVSKCGKSWLRQRVIPNALVVQCRLGKTVLEIYREALGELGIKLQVQTTKTNTLTGTVEATADIGNSLIAKLRTKFGYTAGLQDTTTTQNLRQDINDLAFIAGLIRESGRRLVIEDFHYLSVAERKKLAFDLKALWDYNTFVVIVGVWSDKNILPSINPDLGGRYREVSIVWQPEDLRRIFVAGGTALNIEFSDELMNQAIADCHENAGILQRLIEGILEEAEIEEEVVGPTQKIEDAELLESAALNYADELTSIYQNFASRVSSGIRTRANATGIYAHAMAVIMDADDAALISGVPLREIFLKASEREPRIQQGNLKTVLERLQSLQVDEDGRGLVLAYDNAEKEVSVVDRQLLLYRKYATVRWPWEDLVQEAVESGETFAAQAETLG